MQAVEFTNEILAQLPQAEADRLVVYLRPLSLVSGQILHEPGEHVTDVYFLESGLASILAFVPAEKAQVAISLLGPEGMTGLTTILGRDRMCHNTVQMQVAGHGYRLSAEMLHLVMRSSPVLQRLLRRRLDLLHAKISQAALCNGRHSLQQRLAFWLLAAQDRLAQTDLPIGQGAVADMLMTHRPMVTVALQVLVCRGVVQLRRGHIQILDRTGLEADACACYAHIRLLEQGISRQAAPSLENLPTAGDAADLM